MIERRDPAPGGPSAEHRAGVVALLGRPNAGKSTLLNRLVGEKLAIVSPKPQTTRGRLLGILTVPGAQLLLWDTPGVHESATPLGVAMNEAVVQAAADCDVALYLVDPAQGFAPEDEALLERLAASGVPVLLVATKCDRGALAAEGLTAAAGRCAATLRVSARTGEGIEALLSEVVARLPVAPALFPEDELTDRPLRFLAGELVREAAFRALQQELPYALAVEVRDFDESRADLVRIRADLIVMRDSQKRIVIGAGGAKVKEIGVAARREIERLVGRQVHLELWVKVEPDWARRPRRLEELGYR